MQNPVTVPENWLNQLVEDSFAGANLTAFIRAIVTTQLGGALSSRVSTDASGTTVDLTIRLPHSVRVIDPTQMQPHHWDAAKTLFGQIALPAPPPYDPENPTVDSVIDRFAAYHADEPCWGSLHIVLDDGNVRDGDVDFCIAYAEELGDEEGAELGRILRKMSETQRLKIQRKA